MDMLDDVEFQVAGLALAPGDILAVRAGRPITAVVAAELRAQLEHRLGLQGRVLVLDAGAELTVIAKNDVPDGAEQGQPPLAGLAPRLTPRRGPPRPAADRLEVYR
jgi:uncharacterized protein (DUF1697 family)